MTLKDFFKRIEAQYNGALPFAVYRKPNGSQIRGLLQNSDVLFETEDFNESGFVFSPFNNEERTVLIPLQQSECLESTINANIDVNKDDLLGITQLIDGDDYCELKKQHLNLINMGLEAIKKGQFEKVVLSRTETVTLSKTDPIGIFKRLLNAYPGAFVYCWYHPKAGLWLGATPETLIKIEGSRFSIMSLAATQIYKGSMDVVWSDKEKNEQQIVTDFIVENLKPLVENLSISETQTVKAGNLLHLRTMISAQLKSEVSTLKRVVFDLHPTPAVCGLPKVAAKTFILNNENYNRGYYTGFLGELNIVSTLVPRSTKRNIENRAYSFNTKSTQLYVNLRCMQLQGNKATVFVGGGITKTSNPEDEWEETVSKSLIIKSVLQ